MKCMNNKCIHCGARANNMYQYIPLINIQNIIVTLEISLIPFQFIFYGIP